jgi:hypothetical protein
VLDPLVRSTDQAFDETVGEDGQELGRSQPSRLRPELGVQAHPARGRAGQGQAANVRPDVVGDVSTLALTGEDQLVGGQRPLDRLADLLGLCIGRLDEPGGAGDGLLQRVAARLDLGCRLHVDADGQARGQVFGQAVDVDRLPFGGEQIDVEVLGIGFVTGRESQPEVQLGPGGEPLGVRDRERRAADRPLPHAGHVAVAGEADLAVLGEPEADPHQAGTAAVAAGLRASSVTGTSPPDRRSCPVPWLPPAGGTAEATTCSMPNPVQAPQS